MISRVLIIASPTKQSSISVLDAFQMVRKDRLRVKAIFATYLSDLFKKRLGPNTLSYWVKEEEHSLETIKSYFARADISYDFKVIAVPPWQMIFEEMKDGNPDFLILQGEFLRKWKNEQASCALCSEMILKLRCPVLIVNSEEETF